MNSVLATQVEQVSQACMRVRAGDIATLADLLEQCDTLRQVGEMDGADHVTAQADALAEQVKRMIMGEDDDDTAMDRLRAAVQTLQTAVEQSAGAAADTPATSPGANGGSEPPPSAPTEQAAPTELGGEDGAFAADEELLGEYLTEQRTRLEEIEGHLLALERSADQAALADLRRALHTIKGDSGFLGLSSVAQISHAAESYLEEATYPYELEQLFAVKDWLTRAFEDLANGGRLTSATQTSLTKLLATMESRLSGSEATPATSALAQQADALEPAHQGNSTEVEVEHFATEPPAADPAPAANAAPAQEATPEPTAPAVEKPAFFELTADASLLAEFITESKEHLDNASARLLDLESDPGNEDAINCVFRAFHTVKGIAGFLQLDEIQKLAHQTENLLDQVRRNTLELSPQMLDLVFEALDWLVRLIGNVRTGLQGDSMVPYEPELEPFLTRVSAAQKGQLPVVEKGTRQQRLGEILVQDKVVERTEVELAAREVATSRVEKKIGEALVEKSLVTPGQVHAALRQQAVAGPSVGPRKPVELKETLRVDYERLEDMINTIGELVLAEAMISQDDSLGNIHSEAMDKKLHNLRQVSRKLQELGTTIRMVPISGTFQKMARLVRDLSRKSGKPIEFTSHGDETELDRAYVDLIADPLVHMIRNAVDHGIESSGERRRKGKSETGHVNLRAFHEGGNIHVEIRDDGQGLDPERIFAKAVEKGMVTAEERDRLTEQEIFHFIFQPGFSTAAQVTEVSGRGVGMDVVRRNIAELRGQVQIQSERDKGTLFKIILPLTLALIDGMLVRVGNERFIFPVLSVVESTRPTADMLATVIGRGEMVSLRGRQLPLYRLNRLFGVHGAKENITEALVVVVENDGRQIGVVVDDLIGIQQTVIKNLGNGLFDTMGLSGGSIMADGTVGLIVDIAGLIGIARRGVTEISGAIN